MEAPRDVNPPFSTASISGTWRRGMGRCPSLCTPVHTNSIPYRLTGTCMAYVMCTIWKHHHPHYITYLPLPLSCCLNMCYMACITNPCTTQYSNPFLQQSFYSSVIVHIWTSSFSQTHMSLPQSPSHTYFSLLFLLPRPVLGIRAFMQSYHHLAWYAP